MLSVSSYLNRHKEIKKGEQREVFRKAADTILKEQNCMQFVIVCRIESLLGKRNSEQSL